MDVSNALAVNWAFGFSKDVVGGVHSLTTKDRNAMFYVSSHSGVVYDYENRTQLILQGHCNLITCAVVSPDKRWIVTADAGDDSILVVWDALSGAPVKTIFSPHAGGTCALDLSTDALFVTSLGMPDENGEQDIAIWAWTTDADDAILRKRVGKTDRQISIRFDPSNQAELVTCGSKTVCFWTWKEYSLEGYTGKASKKDVGHYSGFFNGTIFLPHTGSCLTCTTDGYVIVWATQAPTGVNQDENTLRVASKVIRLVECGINILTTVNKYLVTACTDGAIRFYDFSLRLEAWFEDLAAGPVSSVSFACGECPVSDGSMGVPGMQFWAPEFLVGTTDAFIVGVDSQVFEELRPEDRRGVLLVQGMADDVTCIASHPQRPLLAVCCHNGYLQIWDYSMKLLMNLSETATPTGPLPVGQMRPRTADGHRAMTRPICLNFDPSGEFLALGFSNGILKIVNVDSLSDITSYNIGSDPILEVQFCPSGEYMATYDTTGYLMVFKRPSSYKANTKPNSAESSKADKDLYIYLGRIIPHKGAIAGMSFGSREGVDILVTAGADRRCIEYNLQGSSVENGIMIVDTPVQVETSAKPTALLWHPHIGDDVEDRFIYATDDYKFKNINADSKLCRKTTIAPTYGGPINQLLMIPGGSDTEPGYHYAFSTAERIVGLGSLPLTGDPTESMGLVAHPKRITCMCVSNDGKFLFTGGGSDLTVNMWEVDVSVLPSRSRPEHAEQLDSFLELLEGGSGGDLHNDIVEYFYYCQLRTQPEDSMEERQITGRILIEEVPSLLRAVGYYPSEEEVGNILNEIRYKHYMKSGIVENDVGLDDVLKLYVNHRPLVALSNSDVITAFEEIKKKLKLGPHQDVSWSNIEKLLTSEGEVFSRDDLGYCLTALVGADTNAAEMASYDAERFAEAILGFENFAVVEPGIEVEEVLA